MSKVRPRGYPSGTSWQRSLTYYRAARELSGKTVDRCPTWTTSTCKISSKTTCVLAKAICVSYEGSVARVNFLIPRLGWSVKVVVHSRGVPRCVSVRPDGSAVCGVPEAAGQNRPVSPQAGERAPPERNASDVVLSCSQWSPTPLFSFVLNPPLPVPFWRRVTLGSQAPWEPEGRICPPPHRPQQSLKLPSVFVLHGRRRPSPAAMRAPGSAAAGSASGPVGSAPQGPRGSRAARRRGAGSCPLRGERPRPLPARVTRKRKRRQRNRFRVRVAVGAGGKRRWERAGDGPGRAGPVTRHVKDADSSRWAAGGPARR